MDAFNPSTIPQTVDLNDELYPITWPVLGSPQRAGQGREESCPACKMTEHERARWRA
jgi:hypothetical protein